MTLHEHRAFVIGTDGRVQDRHDLICENEAEARERAERLMNGHDIELWQLDRILAVFRHKA